MVFENLTKLLDKTGEECWEMGISPPCNGEIKTLRIWSIHSALDKVSDNNVF